MKKQVLWASLIILSVAAFQSCKKDTLKQEHSTQIDIGKTADFTGMSVADEGYLVFETPQDYENYLDLTRDYSDADWDVLESDLGFVSHYTAYNNTDGTVLPDNTNTLMEDENFLRLIDVYGIVQIGPYIFKASYDDDLVLEMHEDNKSTYFSDFQNGDFVSEVMNELCSATEADSDADIFATLARIGTGNMKTTGSHTAPTPSNMNLPCGSGMGTNNGNNGTSHYNDDKTNGAGTVYRAKCKAVYQNAIFYKSLMTEMKYMSGGPTLWTQRNTNIQFITQWGTYCNFTKKGGSQQSKTPPNGVYDNKLNWRPYSGGKKLTSYDLNAIFGYTDVCGYTSTVQVRTHN